MKARTNHKFIIYTSIMVCGFLAFVEHGVDINYVIKTVVKAGLFILTIWLYIKLYKGLTIKNMVSFKNINHQEWKRLLILGLSSAFIVLIAYLFFKPYIDIENIKTDLTERLGITASGFIFVGLYITFGNSFLEEVFFRGFVFFNLPKKIGYLFSPLLFAAYHIPMIILWFNPFLIALCFIGLWLIGYVFHKVNERTRTIWSSWMIHICADIMIIIIGYSMFYS